MLINICFYPMKPWFEIGEKDKPNRMTQHLREMGLIKREEKRTTRVKSNRIDKSDERAKKGR